MLFLYLKWTVGACILAVLTSVMGNSSLLMNNRELYIMSTGTIINHQFVQSNDTCANNRIPLYIFSYEETSIKNGVQLPENYDEKINKKQTLLSIILRYAIGNVYRCNIINYVFMKDCINTMCNPFYQ